LASSLPRNGRVNFTVVADARVTYSQTSKRFVLQATEDSSSFDLETGVDGEDVVQTTATTTTGGTTTTTTAVTSTTTTAVTSTTTATTETQQTANAFTFVASLIMIVFALLI